MSECNISCCCNGCEKQNENAYAIALFVEYYKDKPFPTPQCDTFVRKDDGTYEFVPAKVIQGY